MLKRETAGCQTVFIYNYAEQQPFDPIIRPIGVSVAHWILSQRH